MQGLDNYKHHVMESDIGDVHFGTILDQGFFDAFGMSFELHSHAYYEILYTLEDGFFLDLPDGIIKEMTPLDICLLPPGTYHGTRPRSTRSKKLALRFHYSKIGKGEDETSLYRMFHHVLSFSQRPVFFSKASDLINVLETLRQETLATGAATKEYTEAVLNQFYLLLMRKIDMNMPSVAGNAGGEGLHDREQRQILIEDYFHQYYPEPVTEDHMAEQIRLSKRQLSRVLREIYGKSFRRLLIEERLNHAAQLLLTTDLSIDEIAYAVGYTSLSGFYSAFRQEFGVTAGKYRKKTEKNK